MINPGMRVLITEDCRDGGGATGKVGIYEGDFAHTIMLGRIDEENERIDWHGEYWYEDYASGKLKVRTGTPIPARDVYTERGVGSGSLCDVGDGPYGALIAVPILNPRICLDDGSVIWGAQCWWCEYQDDLTMDEAQAQKEAAKDVLRALFAAAPSSEPTEV